MNTADLANGFKKFKDFSLRTVGSRVSKDPLQNERNP